MKPLSGVQQGHPPPGHNVNIEPQLYRNRCRPPAYQGPTLRTGAEAWAYTGSRLCHLPRSLIKRQPNTLRGDEVQPAWWSPLKSWLHKKDEFPTVLDYRQISGTQVSPGCAYLKRAVLRQLIQSRRTRRPSRLLLSANRTTLRSVPSVYI